MISRDLLPPTWSMVPLRRVLRKLSRPVHAADEVITAYRDGPVTARSIRREEGYTFSILRLDIRVSKQATSSSTLWMDLLELWVYQILRENAARYIMYAPRRPATIRDSMPMCYGL